MDLAPTLLALAGIDPADHSVGREMRGQSLLPYLVGDSPQIIEGERSMGWEMYSHRALHNGDWKITWVWTPAGEAAWQLYDLSTDPGETTDLAQRHPDRLRMMIEQWDSYARETGAVPLDRDVSGYPTWQLIHD